MWMYLKTLTKPIEPSEAKRRNSAPNLIHQKLNPCVSILDLKMNPRVSNDVVMTYPLLQPHVLPPMELEDLKKISMEKLMAYPLLQDTMASMARERLAIIAKPPPS